MAYLHISHNNCSIVAPQTAYPTSPSGRTSPPSAAAARPPRRLFLHLSALSDTEYTVYIDALRDLLEDDDPDRPVPRLPDDELERRTVGLREVRAWMKGRFRDIGTGEIDKVGMFDPALGARMPVVVSAAAASLTCAFENTRH